MGESAGEDKSRRAVTVALALQAPQATTPRRVRHRPRGVQGRPAAPRRVRATLRRLPGAARATRPCPDLPGRARLRPAAEEHRGDRLPSRPTAARPAALRRLLDLGPSPTDPRAG